MFVLGRKQIWEEVIGETAIKLRAIYILPQGLDKCDLLLLPLWYIYKGHIIY